MKPSWTEVAVFGLLLIFAMVMANGWPEGDWALGWSALSAIGGVTAGAGAFYASHVALNANKKKEEEARRVSSEFCYQMVSNDLIYVARNLYLLQDVFRSMALRLKRAEKNSFTGEDLRFLMALRDKAKIFIGNVKFDSFALLHGFLISIQVEDAVIYSKIKRLIDGFESAVETHLRALDGYNDLEIAEVASNIYYVFAPMEELITCLQEVRGGAPIQGLNFRIRDIKARIYRLSYEGRQPQSELP